MLHALGRQIDGRKYLVNSLPRRSLHQLGSRRADCHHTVGQPLAGQLLHLRQCHLAHMIGKRFMIGISQPQRLIQPPPSCA